MNNLESNLWKLYCYRFFSNFWLIAPILIPFYESNGLTVTQVFIVQSIYLGTLLIFEIPSGYLSDIIGRKKTLTLGACFLPVGLAVYAFSHGFYGFSLAEIILAIAASMRSGTDSALIYDTLLQLKQEAQYKTFEGKAEFYARIGDSVSSVLGGLLALITLRLPFYINIATGFILIPLAITLIEAKRESLEAKNPFKGILGIVKYCLGHPKIRSVLICYSVLMSTGIIGVWSYYMYYGKLGVAVAYYGILLAIFGLCSAYGSKKAHSLESRLGKGTSLSLLLSISIVFILLGQFKTMYLIPLIFLNGFVWGISVPLLVGHLNELVKSEIRATALSVMTMTGSLSFVILAPVFGKIVDSYSLSSAHTALGIFFLIGGSASLILLRRHKVI
jgi:MFS family permease